jgi:hypothetical protein
MVFDCALKAIRHSSKRGAPGGIRTRDPMVPSEVLDHHHTQIVHELLRFSVPNHGKLWKSLMRAHLGDYVRSEEKLRELAEGRE